MTLPGLLLSVLILFALLLSRYLLVAGGSYWILYARPNHGAPGAAIKRDISLSVGATAVFALAAALILLALDHGFTRIYPDLQRYGLWYPLVSYGAVLLLQDTYFYFLHRLFHHRRFYRHCHRGHHLSRRPTPWTSFAFDLPEAFAQALFLAVVVFVIPLHLVTLLAIGITMTVWAVVNHLGLECLPPTFPHHWFGRWFIGPAHHSLHHLNPQRNFGLYFTFWDQLLGSEDPAFRSLVPLGRRP